MVNDHLGEVQFDFRARFHDSFLAVAERDEEEAWRLLGQLLRDPGTHTAAAVAGWERPVSTEAFFLASLYTAWTGERHPLIPDIGARKLTDVESRLADMALENMNRR